MYYIIITVVIVLDQFAKHFVKTNFELYQSVPIIPDILNMTYIHNYGAAFSILQGRQHFLVAFTAVVSMGLLIYMVKNIKTSHWSMLLSLSLIIAGGAGNMIDRIISGYVIDFIELKIVEFPVFNIADMAVVGGSILLIFYILFFETTIGKKRRA